jgi:predicted transcriptional regulator
VDLLSVHFKRVIDEALLLGDHSIGYTFGMKTAVSIPDEVFRGAERLARKTQRSRSRLFSDALKEYLARHTPDSVTEAMDGALRELGEATDEFVSKATRRVLERSEW